MLQNITKILKRKKKSKLSKTRLDYMNLRKTARAMAKDRIKRGFGFLDEVSRLGSISYFPSQKGLTIKQINEYTRMIREDMKKITILRLTKYTEKTRHTANLLGISVTDVTKFGDFMKYVHEYGAEHFVGYLEFFQEYSDSGDASKLARQFKKMSEQEMETGVLTLPPLRIPTPF